MIFSSLPCRMKQNKVKFDRHKFAKSVTKSFNPTNITNFNASASNQYGSLICDLIEFMSHD